MDELFADPTNNDIAALEESIQYLNDNLKFSIIKLIYLQINELITPDNIEKASLFVKSIEHIPKDERIVNLNKLRLLKVDGDRESCSFYHSLGEQYRFIEDYNNAIEYFQKSLSINLKVHGDQHANTAENFSALGLVSYANGEFVKASEYHEKSMAVALKIYGELHSETGSTYNNLGLVYFINEDYEKAIEYYEKALAICLKKYMVFSILTLQ